MEDKDAIIFRDRLANGQPDYNGQYIELYEGQNIENLKSLNINDAISAIWVHPRIYMICYKDANFVGDYMIADGLKKQIWDLNGSGYDDVISSVKVVSNQSRTDWKLACCRNENGQCTDQNKCGKYWSQDQSVCGTLDCDGGKLLTDGVCRNWCMTHPDLCDSIKVAWCQSHVGASECGCINDTLAAQTERNRYPSLTAPRQCWGMSDCQKTDLVQTLVPTSMRPVGCPNINAQIQELNNVILIGSNISQDQTTNSGNSGNSGNTGSNGNTSSNVLSNYWIYILFIVIVCALCIVIFDPFSLFVEPNVEV